MWNNGAVADGELPARIKSPEEHELDLKQNELAALEGDLVEWELKLSTLRAALAAFEREYLRIVGCRYAALDDLQAQIAEARAVRQPNDGAAWAAAAGARQTADNSAAEVQDRAAQEPMPSFEPRPELKTLYRTIARRLHPDLASTDDERARRHEWMAKVNDAYQQQDSEALAALLFAWEASPESVSGTGVASDLVRVIRQIAQVRRRINSIHQAIDTLEAGRLYTLYEKCRRRRRAGTNLLDELAKRLDMQIATARRELAALEAEAR